MKPAWDKLMDDFAGNPGSLVADVDCTAEGKPLCDSNGVEGFPTIKYGDPSNLEKYEVIKHTMHAVLVQPTLVSVHVMHASGLVSSSGLCWQGGRDYDALSAFAKENLGPSCGPANLDLCDADQKAEIEKFTVSGCLMEDQDTSLPRLDAAVALCVTRGGGTKH